MLSVTFLSCLFILLTDTDNKAGRKAELQSQKSWLQHENADLKLKLTHALRQGQLSTALTRAPSWMRRPTVERSRCTRRCGTWRWALMWRRAMLMERRRCTWRRWRGSAGDGACCTSRRR